MDDEKDTNIYDRLVHFIVTLTMKFCKKSTSRELPSMLCVSNVQQKTPPKELSVSNESIASMIDDTKMVDCIRKGLAHVKTFLKQIQASDGGIPVSGGSIESLRVNNIEIDIVSHDAKLFNCAEFEIEDVTSKLSDGVINVKTVWPNAYLAQAYILGGTINGKKVTGTGRFKIAVTNFNTTLALKFKELQDKIEIKDLLFVADFNDVTVNITGLEVENTADPEKLVNEAVQREKAKFKEILKTNTTFLSTQAMTVVNLQLQQTSKKELVDKILSWATMDTM